MKKLGYIMITLGFLGGSLLAVLDESQVGWDWFIVAVGLGVAGVVLVRLTEKSQMRSQHRLNYNMEAIETSLSRIVENISKLNTQKQSMCF